jgi:hydrogenase/urease accessory protein HupE
MSRFVRLSTLILTIAALWLPAAALEAHSLPVGSSRWCFGDHRLVANIDANATLLNEVPGIKEGRTPLSGAGEAQLQQMASRVLQPYLDQKLALTVNDRRIPVKVDRLESRENGLYTIWLSAQQLPLAAQGNRARIDYRLFFDESDNTHLNLAYLYLSDASGVQLQQLFDFSQPVGQYAFEAGSAPWVVTLPAPAAPKEQSGSPAPEGREPQAAPRAAPGGPAAAANQPAQPAATTVARFPDGPDTPEVEYLSQPSAAAPSPETSTFDTFTRFLKLGIEHILTGYDHVAFLVALIVIGLSLREVVKVVTAFTVAHSITLLLAALELVRLNSRLVESAIALSICYVALENLLRREASHRWLVTFAFGLIHGFGFASALSELIVGKANLVVSVLCFNLGVETGQLMIIALLVPLLEYLKARSQLRWVTAGASLAVLVLGLNWLVERVTDWKLLPI